MGVKTEPICFMWVRVCVRLYYTFGVETKSHVPRGNVKIYQKYSTGSTKFFYDLLHRSKIASIQ